MTPYTPLRFSRPHSGCSPRSLLLAGVLTVSLTVSVGCGGPRLRDEFSPATKTYEAEVSGLRLSFWIDVAAEARIEGRHLLPADELPVELIFAGVDFQRVRIFADGLMKTVPRMLFRDDRVRLSLASFAPIGRAKTLAFRFDDDPETYQLDEESQRALHRFTASLEHFYERLRLDSDDPGSALEPLGLEASKPRNPSGNLALGTFGASDRKCGRSPQFISKRYRTRS